MSVRFHIAWLPILFAFSTTLYNTSRTCAQSTTESYPYWIDRALEASQAEKWEESYAAFARAHEAESSARALRGMGVASYRMGRKAEAFSLLQAALNESNMALDDRLSIHVQNFVNDLSEQLGRYDIGVNVSDNKITVDGNSAFFDQEGRILVDSGLHSLTVSATGYQPRTIEISVIPGTIHSLDVELSENDNEVSVQQKISVKPSKATGITEYTIDSETTKSSEQPHRTTPEQMRSDLFGKPENSVESRSRVVTWVAAATIPLFAIGTGLTWYLAQKEGDKIANHCRKVGCSPEERDKVIQSSSLETFEMLTDMGWALLGAATVTTCVAFVFESEQPEPDSRIVLSPAGLHYLVGF